MIRGAVKAWRGRAATVARTIAISGCFVLATTAIAATATADAEPRAATAQTGPTGDATAPVRPQPAKAAKFEVFVREVGIDMSAVPIAVRREWASAPRVGIDDCGIPGTHAGHRHDTARGEQSLENTGAVVTRPEK